MPLTLGARLGSYEIVSALGAGGMGEVYRAHDPKLNRDVAIKVLPQEFASDPERIARFHREAQAVAALNHPHVAAIYELAEADAVRFLVLELVEGDTLAERIGRGRLPADEALSIATQICEALEAAHEKGIVHRDLKPANVKITPDGNVKVLDFGLAKAREGVSPTAGLSNSPTISLAATQAGMILGTAAYMSPEQAKGLTADHRSDLFSFGCVLYEMLTGRHAFDGDTVSEILASVLKSEADLSLLPAKLNPRIGDLLRRCLAKNPKERWHAAADVRAEIQAAVSQGVLVEPPVTAAQRPLWKRSIPVALGMLVASVTTGLTAWMLKPPPPPAVITRFPIFLGEGQSFTFGNRRVIAISPDGTKVAYVATERLYLRSMSELDAHPIPGAEVRVSDLVFSPDGGSIAFYSIFDGTLKKIIVTGGAAVTVCPADLPGGMSWGQDGIVFAQGRNGIIRVSANGGTPENIVSMRAGEAAYSPQMLPGGNNILFTLNEEGSAAGDSARVVVQTLGSGERKTLVEGGSDARYVPTGHIIYGLGGTLMAVPFDAQLLEVTGGPVPVVEGVRRSQSFTVAHFSVSDGGSLVYIPGPVSTSNAPRHLAWSDRNGEATPLNFPPGPYQFPRMSADGRRVAFETDDGKEAIVWIYDLDGTSAMRRLTFGGRNKFPVWSADSQWVAFQSDREGDTAIFRQRADGTGAAERLTKPDEGTTHAPESWSPDGGHFLFRVAKGTDISLWVFSLKEKKAVPFGDVRSSNPTNAVFSPDGRWVAYHAREPGLGNLSEVFVQPFPATGAKYQLPIRQDNHHPLWLSGGRELFFDPGPGSPDAVVSVTTDRNLAFGNPVPTTMGLNTLSPAFPRPFDVMPAGERFIGVVSADGSQDGVPQIQVVLNWFEDLKARVPVR